MFCAGQSVHGGRGVRGEQLPLQDPAREGFFCGPHRRAKRRAFLAERARIDPQAHSLEDRKSTRLNSSHVEISYAVFCLKKKKKNQKEQKEHQTTIYTSNTNTLHH